MKVLFDHNVPYKLRRSLTTHQVSTADQMQWAELENGELLTIAEVQGFEVMVTCDKNLSYQQNLKGRNLALVVLSTNDWNVIQNSTELVSAAVNQATPGSFNRISFPGARY